MKKIHIAKAAYLNPCIFLGLLVFFAGVFLALLAMANPQALMGGDDEATAIAVDHAAVQYVPEPTPTPTPTCTSGPWVATQAMPLDLYAAAGASDGTYSYHFGGYTFSQGHTVAVVNRYNPATNAWASMAPMPQSAIMATAVYYPTTNKIYVFGGSDGATGTAYNMTRIYDIASNTWTTGANMPNVHTFAAGGYIPATGKIYIISGYNSGSSVNTAQPNTWQYDPVPNSWTDLTASAPIPHAVGGAAYGVINNKVYIAGGRDAGNTIVNLTWAYNPVTNAYTQLADEPSTFQNNVPGSAAASGLLWVFGGGNPFISGGATQPATSSSGRFYNPATNTWGSSPNLNTSRSFPSGAAIGSSLIIAAGGYNGSTSAASAETESVCGLAPTPTATATASPTATRTPTPTATPTPTPTPTPCSGRCSPTPRPSSTLAGRPTPPPHLTPPPTASPSVTPAPRPTPPPRLTPPPTPTGSPRPTPRPRP